MDMTPKSTGDARVDQAVAGLEALADLPLDEHPAALEAVHDRLREILGELGDAGRPGAQGRTSAPGAQAEPGEPGRRGEQEELGRGDVGDSDIGGDVGGGDVGGGPRR
jgi:hypothetical protein